MGILVSVSNLTAVPWNTEPTDQSIATLTSNTAVTFSGADQSRERKGVYRVLSRHVTLAVRRPSTGEIQRIRVNIREPIGANGKRPAIVFMHGAGYGTSDNSFGDVAHDLASAGFVTAVPDKPVWSTNDITRDYPGSAKAYDQVIGYLRGMSMVDADEVGIYATSESTWISPYLHTMDHRIAFQILLSPMAYSPRESLGFFIAQDFTLVGANNGYQSIVRRVFHTDSRLFDLANLDVPVQLKDAYSIPTFVAYGSKDVMTAQVEGIRTIIEMAHAAGNRDITVRSYMVANHVLRLGDEANAGTQLSDNYIGDVIDWAVGETHHLEQSSERVAGSSIYQSIAVPVELKSNRVLTVYGLILHVAMVVTLVAALCTALVALGAKIHHVLHRRGPVLAFLHGFGSSLLALTVITMASLVLFAAGLSQVVVAVVKLAWGGAPAEDPGMMYWSWPVIQIVCTLVVWAWSRVLAKLLEAASIRGLVQIPPRKGAIRALVSGHEPVLATTRFGRVLFWITTAAMLHVLLMFAFWGMFIY
jgi:acetyl esterase/lipase